ncbi:MAG: hypothetical protein AT712_06830 [Caldivirga sp. CIS_19]|nr:MAG: hypothetical protein AT712_06830 [Caldivirga sp. CIS_19]
MKTEGSSDPLRDAVNLFMSYISETEATAAAIRGSSIFMGIINYLKHPIIEIKEKGTGFKST